MNMSFRTVPVYFLIFLFFAFCKKQEENQPDEPPEGCINLSDLITKQDYYLPFAIENNDNGVSTAVLNNKPVEFSFGNYLEFTETGFYELVLIYDDQQKAQDTIFFTTKTEEREASEWGIKTWVPVQVEHDYLSSEDVEIIYPRHYADSISVPFIFYVLESGSIIPVYCEGICPDIENTFNIKRGVGSVNISTFSISNQVKFIIGGKQVNASMSRYAGSEIELKGTVNTSIEIPANSLVRIRKNLYISSAGSLRINEGTLVLIDKEVDINISGPVVFSGTVSNPVLVTCSRSNQYWGGFITREPGGTIEAEYTIFCQSGFHDTEGYIWGHAGRQALFCTENSTLTLDHCYMTDHAGQIFYPLNSVITLDNILVQRVKTGGQINNSDLFVRNSVFTDFPDDSQVFSDNDNDALYLSASDAIIENTVFMFAKDDGLDSGNIEGGDITLSNCRFEACFHEGAALSSGGNALKNHTFTACIFTNCGQGLELGFSSPDHSVVADNCVFMNNGIGIRYGDNYTWSEVNGHILIRNSMSLNNNRDVWNMVRMNWRPKLGNMNFEDTKVSEYCPQYPELEVLN